MVMFVVFVEPGVGLELEPCNYIRGFILLEYTKRFNEFLNCVLPLFLYKLSTSLL